MSTDETTRLDTDHRILEVLEKNSGLRVLDRLDTEPGYVEVAVGISGLCGRFSYKMDMDPHEAQALARALFAQAEMALREKRSDQP